MHAGTIQGNKKKSHASDCVPVYVVCVLWKAQLRVKAAALDAPGNALSRATRLSALCFYRI